jgi:hypothetical protein
MGFLKSAINQVGRDLGKVVSNQIFQDSHSTPYRRVGGKRDNKDKKTDFEAALDFQMSHRPSTLVRKLSGVYSLIKNEIESAIKDDYLSSQELQSLLTNMSKYNKKMLDVAEILELNETKNEQEIVQVQNLNQNLKEKFYDCLDIAQVSSLNLRDQYLKKSSTILSPNLPLHMILTMFWMNNYSLSGRLYLMSTIFMNLVTGAIIYYGIINGDVYTRILVIYVGRILYGFLTFPKLKSKFENLESMYKSSASKEEKKVEIINDLLNG